MNGRLWLAVLWTVVMHPAVRASDPRLEPGEAEVVRAIVATERFEVEAVEMPGWAKLGAVKSLADYGVDTGQIRSGAVALKERPAVFLGFLFDANGRVLALCGNGPWLRNDSLRSLVKLPELRMIRIDHNGFVGRDPRIPEFDGRGFEALVGSKLMEIKIGLSLSDRGMEQCAKIGSLRSFSVGHSRVTEAGVAFFAGHPNLREFSIAEMAGDRVTEKALGQIAKIPGLTRIGFHECYVTYEGGFQRLAPLKGRLERIDLSMSVAAPSDLDKLQADHPHAKIVVIPPAEIVKRHKFIAANLAKQVPPELAAPLNEALGR